MTPLEDVLGFLPQPGGRQPDDAAKLSHRIHILLNHTWVTMPLSSIRPLEPVDHAPLPSLVKPTHKAVQAYYQTLKDYSEHYVGHETALRSAFQKLLAETAKAHRWMLVPEQRTKVGGKTVIHGVRYYPTSCRSINGSAAME